MHTFFSNEFPFVFPSEIPRCGLLIILLINAKQNMLIATILLILDKMPDVVYDTDS